MWKFTSEKQCHLVFSSPTTETQKALESQISLRSLPLWRSSLTSPTAPGVTGFHNHRLVHWQSSLGCQRFPPQNCGDSQLLSLVDKQGKGAIYIWAPLHPVWTGPYSSWPGRGYQHALSLSNQLKPEESFHHKKKFSIASCFWKTLSSESEVASVTEKNQRK